LSSRFADNSANFFPLEDTPHPARSALATAPGTVCNMDEPEQAGSHQRYLTNSEQQVHGNTPDGRVAARLMA